MDGGVQSTWEGCACASHPMSQAQAAFPSIPRIRTRRREAMSNAAITTDQLHRVRVDRHRADASSSMRPSSAGAFRITDRTTSASSATSAASMAASSQGRTARDPGQVCAADRSLLRRISRPPKTRSSGRRRKHRRATFEFPGGRRFHFSDGAGNVLAVWSE